MHSHFVLSLHEMTKVWPPNIFALNFFPRRKSLDGKYGIELLKLLWARVPKPSEQSINASNLKILEKLKCVAY